LFVALCRILRTPCERAAEKVEALWHILTMGPELSSLLGKNAEGLKDALAMFQSLKLRCVETPGEGDG
jgi:hypothetical protein